MSNNRTGIIIGGIATGVGLLFLFGCCGCAGLIFTTGVGAAKTRMNTIAAHNELIEFSNEWESKVKLARENSSATELKGATHELRAKVRLIDVTEVDKDYRQAFKNMLVKLDEFVRVLDKVPESIAGEVAYLFTGAGGLGGLKNELEQAGKEFRESITALDKIVRASK